MTDTDTAVCPICRGTIGVALACDRDRPSALVIVEHIDTTGLRCEGSFTRLDQEQA